MVVKKDPLIGYQRLDDLNDLKESLDRVEQELQGFHTFIGAAIQLSRGEDNVHAIYTEGAWWVKFGG